MPKFTIEGLTTPPKFEKNADEFVSKLGKTSKKGPFSDLVVDVENYTQTMLAPVPKWAQEILDKVTPPEVLKRAAFRYDNIDAQSSRLNLATVQIHGNDPEKMMQLANISEKIAKRLRGKRGWRSEILPEDDPDISELSGKYYLHLGYTFRNRK